MDDVTTTDAALANLKRLHLILLIVAVPLSCMGGAVLAAARATIATRAYALEVVNTSATAAATKAVAGVTEELHQHVNHYETVGKPVMLGFRSEVRTHNARTDGALEALCEAVPKATAKCLRALTAQPPPSFDLSPARY